MTSPQYHPDPNAPYPSANLPQDLPLHQDTGMSRDREDPAKPSHMPQKTVAHVERNRGGYLTWFIITVIVLGLIVLAAWYVSP